MCGVPLYHLYLLRQFIIGPSSSRYTLFAALGITVFRRPQASLRPREL